LSSEDLNIIKNEVYKSYEKKDVFFTSTVNNKGIEELKKYIYNELEKLNTK
jgi:ethanolamine utilization protein EutP (predicted NTPase)